MKLDSNYNNILIIGNFRFPSGSASAERIRAYANSFSKQGMSVKIIALVPNFIAKNEWLKYSNEITYKYLNISSSKSIKNRLGKLILLHFFQSCNIGKEIKLFHKTCPKGLVFIYERRASILIPLLTRIVKCKLDFIIESVEWFHYTHFTFGWFNPHWWDEYFGRLFCVLYKPKILCISKYIQDKYNKLGLNTILVPAIVDANTYPKIEWNGLKTKRSCRCVYIGQFKSNDGYDFAVNGIIQLINEGYNCYLDLIGDYKKSKKAIKIKEDISHNLSVKNRIRFAGYVSEEVKNKYLSKCDFILLTRLNNQDSIAAFPTRLAEFLLTSIPVICSKVGDVTLYMKHKHNALLHASGNLQQFKLLIKEFINSEDKINWKQIGENGRKTALKCFTPEIYIENILK